MNQECSESNEIDGTAFTNNLWRILTNVILTEIVHELFSLAICLILPIFGILVSFLFYLAGDFLPCEKLLGVLRIFDIK